MATTKTDRSLQDKAIDIKGKAYVQVADRILYFNDTYPTGSIETEDYTEAGSDRVMIKATVTPDAELPGRKFVGRSQAVWGDGYINKTSALENAETSAVGRALAFMGIGVLDGVASVDEIKKAEGESEAAKRPIGATAKSNIYAMISRATELGATVTLEDYEKSIGKQVEHMTELEGREAVKDLKSRLDRLMTR